MLHLAIVWAGIIAAALLLLVGAGLLALFLRRLVRARRARRELPAEKVATEFFPHPAYRQYDPANPHYRDGYQYADGAWHQVQVRDEQSGQWMLHRTGENGIAEVSPVGAPAPVKRSPRVATSIAGVAVAAVFITAAVPLGVASVPALVDAVAATGILPREIVAESDQYRYTAPVTIGSDEKLTYQYRIDTMYFGMDDYEAGFYDNNGMVTVYRDSALTEIASYSGDTDSTFRRLTIQPEQPQFDTVSDGVAYQASWSPNSQLYLVQYVDQDGKEYDKPIVTRADIRPDGLATPVVTHSVEQGVLALEWAPVEGATGYRVVYEAARGNGTANYAVLDQLDAGATSWRSTDPDADPDACEPGMQNCALAVAAETNAQAQWNEESGLADEARSFQASAYGVIAVADGGKWSAMQRIPASDIEAQLPVLVESWNGDIISVTPEGLPNRLPVTTVAGTQAYLPLVYASDDPVARTVTLQLAGTSIELTASMSDESGAWDSVIAGIQTRMAADVSRTGGLEESLRAAVVDFDANEEISTEMPEVDYPIEDDFGELGTYLAGNLIATKSRIDVTRFANEPYDLGEMLDAVIAQNPYILGVDAYSFDDSDEGALVVNVSYSWKKEDIVNAQQQMAQKADEIIAAVITDGMSDRDKALALNDWIRQNAEYDYAAYEQRHLASDSIGNDPVYRRAWSPSGILLEGVSVCEGYAEAYKLLSDEAGIRSIVVTGSVGFEGHAWNKTFMDGKWQVVDPTWNDDESPNRLFGITDQVALDDFDHSLPTATNDWMIGPLTDQYAAN